MQAELPPGVEIKPYSDRNKLVGRTIDTVAHLVEGAALVVVVLLVLLGTRRAGLIVLSRSPACRTPAVDASCHSRRGLQKKNRGPP